MRLQLNVNKPPVKPFNIIFIFTSLVSEFKKKREVEHVIQDYLRGAQAWLFLFPFCRFHFCAKSTISWLQCGREADLFLKKMSFFFKKALKLQTRAVNSNNMRSKYKSSWNKNTHTGKRWRIKCFFSANPIWIYGINTVGSQVVVRRSWSWSTRQTSCSRCLTDLYWTNLQVWKG